MILWPDNSSPNHGIYLDEPEVHIFLHLIHLLMDGLHVLCDIHPSQLDCCRSGVSLVEARDTPPMIILKAYDMLIWKKGDVESCIGVSHLRLIEGALISCFASLTMEKMTPW